MPVIDIHCHFVPRALPDFAEQHGDPRWPTLVVSGTDARIMQAGSVYRVVDDSYYSLEVRLEQMDELGVDQQVLSPLPVMLPWWAQLQPALEYCRAFNEELASSCADHPRRFRGFGTVPLQDPQLAVGELERVKDLGLAGVEIGTWLGHDATLSDEPVLDVFRAAAELDVPILLHPNAPQTFAVPVTPAIEIGVGVTSDTSRALASLHLSGALHDCAGLRVCASHGAGSFLWLWPRFQRLAARAGGPEDLPPFLHADTAGLDAANVAYVSQVLGDDRVMFGSDLPAAGVEATRRLLATVRDADAAPRLSSENAEAFLAARSGSGTDTTGS